MKNSLKRLFASVLSLMIVFSAFGMIVSAETTATLTAVEADTGNKTPSGDTVYAMTFTITIDSIRSLAVAFSYDTTAIQPVDPYSNNEDVIMSTDESASTANGYAFDGYSSGRNELKVQGAKYVISGDRAGICPTVSTTSAFSATAGVTALKFYYRIKDASKMNRETFKFETDYGTGSILATLYPVKNEAAAIVANGSYKYGAADGTVDSFAAPTWTYTGSDVPAGGTVEPTTPNVDGVEFADVTKTYDGAAATIATPDVSAIAGIASATVTYSSGAAPVNAGTYTATLAFTVTDETLYNKPADKTATITINPKAVTYTVDNKEKKADAENPAFTGSFAEGALVGDDTVEDFVIKYTLDGTTINATVTNDNYDVRVVPGTLTINAVEKAPTTVEVLETLKVGDKTYKDLCVVNAVIGEGFIGKAISQYGVRFKDAADETKGGAEVAITPEEGVLVLGEGASLEFSAAVIGVPTGVKVKAIPFVVYK